MIFWDFDWWTILGLAGFAMVLLLILNLLTVKELEVGLDYGCVWGLDAAGVKMIYKGSDSWNIQSGMDSRTNDLPKVTRAILRSVNKGEGR